MKEHYVTYNQAVKLKELGFDLEVRGYYTRNDNFRKVWEVTALNHNDTKKFKNILSAPRLDQAQAWLRDKRHYEVNAFYCYDCSKWESYAYDMTMPPLMGTDPLDIFFDTYEQALSAGIDKALELLTNRQRYDKE